jgi:Mn2+/Fe2+ NRAMP family transporter
VLWVLCEIAIAACDLAEVIGAAIALNLLFGLRSIWGVCTRVPNSRKACRDSYSKPTTARALVLWRDANAACDLAEVIAPRSRLNLRVRPSAHSGGVCSTALDVLIVL